MHILAGKKKRKSLPVSVANLIQDFKNLKGHHHCFCCYLPHYKEKHNFRIKNKKVGRDKGSLLSPLAESDL